MSVSKRLRFEVLRRDDYTCRYCGGRAPDVALTVDHVVAATLGGSDEPSNLVAACADCNSGKSATPPDAAVVRDVEADAERWSAAIAEVARQRKADVEWEREMLHIFHLIWTKNWYVPAGAPDDEPLAVEERIYAWRPADADETVLRFLRAGLDEAFLRRAYRIAFWDRQLPPESVWRYFCGICWRELDARRDGAVALLRRDEQEGRD